MNKADAMRYIMQIKKSVRTYADDFHRDKYEEALDFALEYMLKKNSRIRKPTISEMAERLRQGNAIFGLYWGEIKRISAGSLDMRDKGYCYCTGHGEYDWYTPENYGETWGWNLRDINEACLEK